MLVDAGRAFYLPRLQPEFYQADAVVLWTMPVKNRATGWLTAQFHQSFRELMLHAAALADSNTRATAVLVASSGTGKTTASLGLIAGLLVILGTRAAVGEA